MYRSDHSDGTAHAGFAIIISSQFLHYPTLNFQIPTIHEKNTSITLNQILTKIAAVYCPPKQTILSQQTELFLWSLNRAFIAREHPN